jgi:molecular chaperone GrpE (heat shock protein)
MSDEAPAGVAGNAAVDAGSHLTPEAIETILNDFRVWLQQTAGCADVAAPMADGPGFSMQTVTAEFTALRHEVNLLTRAARSQQEQNAETLRQLGETVHALEEASEAADDADAETLRPLLKTLVDLYDVLALARREVQRVEALVQSLLGPALADDAPLIEPPARKRWWPWWSGHSAAAPAVVQVVNKYRQEQAERRRVAEQVQQFFASVVTGYTMSLQRIDRALQQHDLEPMICVGEPFDPECMEVVEVVNDPGRSGTEVLEEVRRGYRWHDRLFRCAQVRVSRP